MNCENLKKLRKSKHWTREEISFTLGISKFTYRSYEQGLREPSIQVLREMAKKLNCTTDELI